jgi:hypothetical protein
MQEYNSCRSLWFETSEVSSASFTICSTLFRQEYFAYDTFMYQCRLLNDSDIILKTDHWHEELNLTLHKTVGIMASCICNGKPAISIM